MELTTATQNSALTNATPSKDGTDGPAGLTSDFETFLNMLTVQMKNQDPLNPVKSSDFAAQLATFSSVEQQVQTNELLKSLGEQVTAQSMGQLAGWIGMDAAAEMPVRFDGAPVTLSVSPAAEAEAASLVVRDAAGAVVQRAPMGPALTRVSWAGLDADGYPLPPGEYHLETESVVGEEVVSVTPVEVHGTIAEARQEAGQPMVVMTTGQTVPAGDIRAVMPPETPGV